MKKILLVLILLTLVCFNLSAQAPPPPPPSGSMGGTNGPVGGSSPIGDGILIFVISALVYPIIKFGAAKSGKTTLDEAMLTIGGLINRRGSVEDKNSVSDYREIELER